jgi:tetratricopeptide (TPR) repeat protein
VDWCPGNFKPYAALIDARLAMLKRDNDTATKLYDQAIATAKQQGGRYITAIAYECAANFYVDQKRLVEARPYFIEAYRLFKEWGGLLKCRQLAKAHPELLSS